MRLKIVLLFLSLLSASLASAQSRATEAYIKFCEGKEKEAAELLGGESEVERRMFSLMTRSGRDLEKEKLKDGVAFTTMFSPVDRVIAAALMIGARSQDFVKIRELLRFQPSDQKVEGYRLAFEAQLDFLSGQTIEALSKLDRSIDINASDSSVLGLALASQAYLNVPLPSKALEKYKNLIESFPNEDPSKQNLEAHFELAQNGWKNRAAIIKLFEQSFQKCSRDPALALNFASVLLSVGKSEQAQEIMEKMVFDYPDSYSPYVDILLGGIYLKSKEIEKASAAIERARYASVYLDPQAKMNLLAMHVQLQQMEKEKLERYKMTSIVASIFAFVLSLILAMKLIKTSKMNPS